MAAKHCGLKWLSGLPPKKHTTTTKKTNTNKPKATPKACNSPQQEEATGHYYVLNPHQSAANTAVTGERVSGWLLVRVSALHHQTGQQSDCHCWLKAGGKAGPPTGPATMFLLFLCPQTDSELVN